MSSRSQIVATIGPSSKDPSVLDQMIAHQMDVARLNFSWGTHEEHALHIANIRAAAQRARRNIPIIQDLSGPRIQDAGGHRIDTTAQSVITEKDLNDLRFGLSQNVEYICLSYVGTKNDMEELRQAIARYAGKAKIIAKVERQKALDNINEIIAVSDAVMIGRGDLGNEVPIESIPFIEQEIILKCKGAGKPVITATQMMFTMLENETPTRAEVTDIAYAILLGSDAVMLSDETARGKYPVQSVGIMENAVLEAERHLINPIINPL